jgi:hypothetical protein
MYCGLHFQFRRVHYHSWNTLYFLPYENSKYVICFQNPILFLNSLSKHHTFLSHHLLLFLFYRFFLYSCFTIIFFRTVFILFFSYIIHPKLFNSHSSNCVHQNTHTTPIEDLQFHPWTPNYDLLTILHSLSGSRTRTMDQDKEPGPGTSLRIQDTGSKPRLSSLSLSFFRYRHTKGSRKTRRKKEEP